ncbi:MAG: hypothetical protein WD825_16310 [Gemmatimonadaceae bacterium]
MLTPESAPALKFLGGAVIQLGDAPLGGPAAHRRRLALLALLATSARPMSRDKLIALLWPEGDEERGRNSLKTAVYELRKLIGEHAIRTTGDQLSIDLSIVRCDVSEFEAAVAAGDFEKAAALYGGPFLDGFFINDTHEFERWADMKRARLAESYARVIEHLAAKATTRDAIATSSAVVAHAAPAVERDAPIEVRTKWIARRLPLTVASALALGLAAVVIASAGNTPNDGVTLASATPVILADEDPGTALEFDGSTANASTAVGTLVTAQLDNVAVDMMVRLDGRTSHPYQMIFYNGHGAVTGWGLMVLGAADGQAEGTVGVIAGGIALAATSLVLKTGLWQRLGAERRQGKLTVTLDDSSYVVGDFPVNTVAGKHRAIEQTTIGGDGSFEAPKGHFRGAIDRVRILDLASNFSIDRWNFDEGKGTTTVGAQGTVVHIGNAQWTAGSRAQPRDGFWSRMQALCGHAFGGRVTEGSPADSALRRAALVMHVRSCAPTEIRIAFHAGTDRSRTWVLTRTAAGLRLKHDHRHADGTEDAITQYGGDTRDSGSFGRQEFHADAQTASLIPAARTNVWSMEIVPGKQFAYALRRVGTDRRFRVEFDLVRHLASPPPPWGATR